MVKLEEVLKNFEGRLSAIEEQLRQLVGSAPTQVSQAPQADKLDKRIDRPSSSYVTQTPPIASLPKNGVRAGGPTFDSSSALGVIGIIFVILAGIFFIKITIDSGWLTPARQILIAAGTGLAFFFAPQFFSKAEKEYAALLAGAGTTILHLTWLGAYFYHHILSANSALICATMIGIFSILSNFDKGNRLYLLVAMAGTYLAAPIIGYNTGELSVLSIFLVIWNISFSATALMNKRRDILFIASYYAVFTVLLLSGKALGVEQKTELLILQLIQFVIFSGALLSYSIHYKNPFSADESVAVLPLLLLFYFSAGHLISAISPEFAPWLGVTIGAVVLGIYFFARTVLSGELQSGSTLTAFAAMAFVHSFYFQLLDEYWQPLAALIIGMAAMVAWSKSEKVRATFSWPLMIFLATFFYGAVLTIVSVKSIETMFFYNWAYGAVVLVAALGVLTSRGATTGSAKYSSLLLGFGHLEVMLGLYRFSEQISWSGALFVTISWGIYAALILTIAYWRRDKILGNSALTILLAVSLKAFFYDVSNTSNLIRVACLLAEGLLLYSCGWIFKKMQHWTA